MSSFSKKGNHEIGYPIQIAEVLDTSKGDRCTKASDMETNEYACSVL